MLGGRVEIFISTENKWYDYSQMIGISSKCKIRVAIGDENILQQAIKLIPKFYNTVEYMGYDYLIPNNAIEEGSFIIMQYSLGAVVKMTNGVLVDVSSEETKELLLKNQNMFKGQLKEFFEIVE